MKCAGLDIGGANIKFASTAGESEQVSFPFWKQRDRFGEILREFRPLLNPSDRIGVTMTAELADCFQDKKSGVEFIVNAIESVFGQHQPLYYQTDGAMCVAAKAIEDWHLVAASNWHAIAWLASNDSAQRSGFVFDIGSTTTDIIPIQDGKPVIDQQDDLSRLSNGQLYYGGIGRTPLCGLLDHIETERETISTANELFATTRDLFIWRNELPADVDDLDSADGRSNSRNNAGKRLARMICSDLISIDESLVDAIALQARRNLVSGISRSLSQVVSAHPELPLSFVTFGSGAWLAEEIVADVLGGNDSDHPAPTICSYSEQISVNQTAAALAVAKKRHQIFEQSLQTNE